MNTECTTAAMGPRFVGTVCLIADVIHWGTYCTYWAIMCPMTPVMVDAPHNTPLGACKPFGLPPDPNCITALLLRMGSREGTVAFREKPKLPKKHDPSKTPEYKPENDQFKISEMEQLRLVGKFNGQVAGTPTTFFMELRAYAVEKKATDKEKKQSAVVAIGRHIDEKLLKPEELQGAEELTTVQVDPSCKSVVIVTRGALVYQVIMADDVDLK